jgi:hypothetical protein
MNITRMMWVVAAALGLSSCGGGDPVALNERIFLAESMQLEGGGCTLYDLGGSEAVHSETGMAGSAVVIKQRLNANEVVVSVVDGDQTLAEKHYDEAFFKAGTLDEFTVTPNSGSSALLLRYWGKFQPNGIAGCTPLDQDGP